MFGRAAITLGIGPHSSLPHFSAHVYCGQTAGSKMPLGTKVGLGPGHNVLHGDPAPPEKRDTAPAIFGPCLLWPNGRPSQFLLSTCSLLWQMRTVSDYGRPME